MNEPNTLTPVGQVLGIRKWKKLEHITPEQLNLADLSDLPDQTILECEVSLSLRIRIGMGKERDNAQVVLTVLLIPEFLTCETGFYNLFHHACEEVCDENDHLFLPFRHKPKQERVSHYYWRGFRVGSNRGSDVIPAAENYRGMLLTKFKKILQEWMEGTDRMLIAM